MGRKRFIYWQSWRRKDVACLKKKKKMLSWDELCLGFAGNFRVLLTLSVFAKAGKDAGTFCPAVKKSHS